MCRAAAFDALKAASASVYAPEVTARIFAGDQIRFGSGTADSLWISTGCTILGLWGLENEYDSFMGPYQEDEPRRRSSRRAAGGAGAADAEEPERRGDRKRSKVSAKDAAESD